MSRNAYAQAPTSDQVAGFLGKNNHDDDSSEESEFGKLSHFIASDGRSTIVELSIKRVKSGYELQKFESLDSNEPEDKLVVASNILEAAKHFVDIDHVGLEVQSY